MRDLILLQPIDTDVLAVTILDQNVLELIYYSLFNTDSLAAASGIFISRCFLVTACHAGLFCAQYLSFHVQIHNITPITTFTMKNPSPLECLQPLERCDCSEIKPVHCCEPRP